MSRWNRRGSLCTSSPPIWTADLESKVTALAFLLKMYLTTCYPIIKNVISSPLCIIHINLGTSRDSTYFVAKDESASKGDLQSMKGNNLLQQLVIYLHGVYSSCMWWMSAVVLLYLLPHRLAMKDTRPVFEFPSFPSLWWDLHSSADFSLVPIWSPGLETTLPRSGHSSWLHVVTCSPWVDCQETLRCVSSSFVICRQRCNDFRYKLWPEAANYGSMARSICSDRMNDLMMSIVSIHRSHRRAVR